MTMEHKIVIDHFEIQTWFCKHAEPQYLAVNMSEAIKKLKGYDLTDDEKHSVVDLMAGYCRLVDEAGLTGYGDTEF
jgi:hemerythrin-like domain-containing protein